MASFLGSIFGFEFGTKIYLFWRLWQVIPDWLVLDATGCEQSELLLLCCGSTSMIPTASLWNKSLATGCSMMVYPWVDTCCLEGASRRCSGTVYEQIQNTLFFIRSSCHNNSTEVNSKRCNDITQDESLLSEQIRSSLELLRNSKLSLRREPHSRPLPSKQQRNHQ